MAAMQIVIYVCAALFAAFVAAKAIRYARTPIHLRWELYPVAHEKGRAEYGGSIFEELDWWTKPKEADHLNEAKEMIGEIIFLKGVFHNNRGLWLFSFPFHFGLYLIIAWLGLMLIAAILTATGVTWGPGLQRGLDVLLAVVGYGGLALTFIGSLGLLLRRLGNSGLRRYSAPIEFLNLVFFMIVTGAAIVVQTTNDPWFRGLVDYFTALVSFRPATPLTAGVELHVTLGALLMAYIPITRMGHFVAKYFLYHDVRWSDEANRRGGAIEGQVQEAFGYRMQWDAPHIQTGKSWGEVGTSPPADQPIEEPSKGRAGGEVSS
jgi:nitrate reductase gamma subunit